MAEIEKCEICGTCIENIEIFRDLDPASKLEIMTHAKHLAVKDKTVIYTPLDRANAILVVKEGKLKLSNYDENGEETIYKILEKNETFGEELIFTHENFNMYIESIGRTMVCQITREELTPYIMENPEFARRLIENLGKKWKEAMTIKRLLFIKNPKERLEGYLANKYEETNNSVIELSRENIGREINLSRETVSRKLMEIQADGNVTLEGYRKIIVNHPEKMKKL